MRIKGKKRRSSSYSKYAEQGSSPRDIINYRWYDTQKPTEPLKKIATFRARGMDKTYYTNDKNEIFANTKDSWMIKVFFWLDGYKITDSKEAVKLWEKAKQDPTLKIQKPNGFSWGFLDGTTYHKTGSIHESYYLGIRTITIKYEKDLTKYNLPEIFFFTMTHFHLVIEKAFRENPYTEFVEIVERIFSSEYSSLIYKPIFNWIKEGFRSKDKVGTIEINSKQVN